MVPLHERSAFISASLSVFVTAHPQAGEPSFGSVAKLTHCRLKVLTTLHSARVFTGASWKPEHSSRARLRAASTFGMFHETPIAMP